MYSLFEDMNNAFVLKEQGTCECSKRGVAEDAREEDAQPIIDLFCESFLARGI